MAGKTATCACGQRFKLPAAKQAAPAGETPQPPPGGGYGVQPPADDPFAGIQPTPASPTDPAGMPYGGAGAGENPPGPVGAGGTHPPQPFAPQQGGFGGTSGFDGQAGYGGPPAFGGQPGFGGPPGGAAPGFPGGPQQAAFGGAPNFGGTGGFAGTSAFGQPAMGNVPPGRPMPSPSRASSSSIRWPEIAMLVALVTVALGMAAVFAIRGNLLRDRSASSSPLLARYDSLLGARVSLGPFSFRPPNTFQLSPTQAPAGQSSVIHKRYLLSGRSEPLFLLDAVGMPAAEDDEDELDEDGDWALGRIVQDFQLQNLEGDVNYFAEELEAGTISYFRVAYRATRHGKPVYMAVYFGTTLGEDVVIFVIVASSPFDNPQFQLMEASVLSAQHNE